LQNLDETGAVTFRGYQTWIYYATWGRLDPLVLGVVLAAIEKFRAHWWQRLTDLAPWLGLPALALIVYALWLGETDSITVTMSVWQFPLIALGMAALLLCAVSPRLPFRRIRIPGAAFIASVAYSAYLIQKLVIHFAAQFCAAHEIPPAAPVALVTVQVVIYTAATILFLAVERPFLQLRHRLVSRG
jgi:peptidoglycan/LPS O-acetylase OafA/YrhL